MSWYLAVLKNYAGFSGRARRKEYWMFFLFNAIVALLLGGLSVAVETTIPYMIYVLAIIVPSLAVSVRRLHDTGRSGWWLLFAFVPVVGGITLFVFTVLEGQNTENEYGPDPKSLSLAV
ncbi:DUF805 domain-containing protein [Streptomyces sp. CC208A]|uniref:DUF805 domain-containing protein n=1 Tax=Streptomyces sp. CC208A TaxID=3044573 RepID=UPI0024A93031|nr:DUF805 domain-containing protein [Streptomyces sp. CC208A]